VKTLVLTTKIPLMRGFVLEMGTAHSGENTGSGRCIYTIELQATCTSLSAGAQLT
jgi:hypothetical protein